MKEHEEWQGKPYYSLNAYMKKTYGEKCYKVAVDAGFTCPNRDGTLDTGGCIFCSAGGSGDFAVKNVDSVKQQIQSGIVRCTKKTGDKFIIYFQAYTNTYGDIEYLRENYERALEEETVIGISIATRPDCLEDDVIKLLLELKRKYDKFIWVELGLQTIHEESAKYIRRHYSLEVYEDAVTRLKSAQIPYITHVILGIPGEDKSMMLQTVRYVNKLEPFGIKLQLLHVLEHTDLADDYRRGGFKTLELEEYLDIVVSCLQYIDEKVVIHRVTGDGPKNILIAPKWSGDKKRVLNTLHKMMKESGAYQGQKVVDNSLPGIKV